MLLLTEFHHYDNVPTTVISHPPHKKPSYDNFPATIISHLTLACGRLWWTLFHHHHKDFHCTKSKIMTISPYLQSPSFRVTCVAQALWSTDTPSGWCVHVSDISGTPTRVGHQYDICPTRGLTCPILKILFFGSDTHRTQQNMARTRVGHDWTQLEYG